MSQQWSPHWCRDPAFRTQPVLGTESCRPAPRQKLATDARRPVRGEPGCVASISRRDWVVTMLMTDQAMRDMEQSGKELTDLCRRFFNEYIRRRPAGAHQTVPPIQPLQVVRRRGTEARTPDGEYRWRRHQQLRDGGWNRDEVSLAEQIRHARATAIRGIFLARGGRLDEARLAFADAAGLAELDLTKVTGFWNLPRAGMMTGALAYEDVGRVRDAAALAAQVRLHCRPQKVASISEPRPTRRERSAAQS